MTDRTNRKEAARAAREAAEAEAMRAAGSRRRIAITAGGFAAVIAVGALGAALAGGFGSDSGGDRVTLPPAKTTELRAAATAAGGRFTKYDWNYGTGAHTTDTVKYPQNPPTNGPHNPQWAADGNYVGRATPQTEQLVHALEHGRIEIQYRPGLPQAQIDQLVALYEEDPQHVLIFENATAMTADVAATAWGHGLLLDRFSPAAIDAIRAFRDTYRDKGPEYVM